MTDRKVNEADVALTRGVKNCGNHHPEDEVSPAIQFARECDVCAGDIFIAVWNASRRKTIENLKMMGYE